MVHERLSVIKIRLKYFPNITALVMLAEQTFQMWKNVDLKIMKSFFFFLRMMCIVGFNSILSL